MSAASLTEPQNCPRCGRLPEVAVYSTTDGWGRGVKMKVDCWSIWCPSYGDDAMDVEAPTLAAAVAAWNALHG